MNYQKVTQEVLKEIVRNDEELRVGATIDYERRAKEYERDGYEGTMYYAPTANMNRAENSLLGECKNEGSCSFNSHSRSNVPEDEGYVYVIRK